MGRPQNTKNSSYSAQMARRRRIWKARLYLLAILILVAVGIWALASTLSQIKTVSELTVDASGYRVLNALPSQSEVEKAEREEEMRIEDEIFEEKENYPIEMIIRTPYCVMYDVQEKRVLYAKNSQEKAFPASTTKILTAAVMMENTQNDTIFTAGNEQELVQPGSSLAYVNAGSSLDRDMMLDALMLPSGNDASYCAAAVTGRLIAGDENLTAENAVKTFVDKMNEKASEIGCKNTHFTCPDGFHNDDHYTTAMDLLRITLYSENFPEIAASGNKSSRELEFLTGEKISWTNSNKLIQPDSGDIYYPYATGLKTGMTDYSGHCVVATAERFGHELIIVCLGSESAAVRWNETIALFDAGFAYIRNNDN
ncbi:MAG: hypothetical protein NC120_00305 [Ruminococcus sp.]|nr:hypothetical protein [Ruminococcus sp.]